MDIASKKRKADENGIPDTFSASKLSLEDARKILEPFSPDQLLDILQNAVIRHPDVLDAVRSVADRDLTQRKLFIRGLGWDTTTDGLRSLFSAYGDLDEAVVIVDKATGKSKGYGFVTFKHIDGALLALKEPSKKIDGRMTVTQLAASGSNGPTANAPATDVSMRKIFVGNVPPDMPPDRLLSHFSSYGEIEEGPLGYDKQTGKSRGFALFVYKTAEAAQASLIEPNKTIDGHHMICKLAIEGKKGKPGAPIPGPGGMQAPSAGAGDGVGDGVGLPQPSSMPNSLPSQFGAPGGLSLFGGLGGFPGGNQGPGLAHQHLNSSLPSSIGGPGGPGLSSVGSQVPSSLGTGGAGYGGGGLAVGPYGSSQYGGPAAGGYGGIGTASSLYRLPPGSAGMPSSGGYPEGGNYGLSTMYQSQHTQQSGSSPAPRVPPGGMYQGMHPYY